MHELREIMLTAYALDELSEGDRRAVEAELQQDAEAQALVDDVAFVAALLQEGLQSAEATTFEDTAADSVVHGRWPVAMPTSAWGTVPNNLAHKNVVPEDRALEIKTVWRSSVLDTVNVTEPRAVTIGQGAGAAGWLGRWGLFTAAPDIDAPLPGLDEPVFPIADATEPGRFGINLHTSFTGHIERADGMIVPIERLEDKTPHSLLDTSTYRLRAEETMYLNVGQLTLQIRYVRKAPFVPPPIRARANYRWLSILVFTLFIHVVAIAAFLSTPRLTEALEGTALHRGGRMILTKLSPAERKPEPQPDLLAQLNSESGQTAGRRRQGPLGSAGTPDAKQKYSKEEISQLFAPRGDGQDPSWAGPDEGGLREALGNLKAGPAAEALGDGLFDSRGSGPGAGGLALKGSGNERLDTRGRGGGDRSYGDGVGRISREREPEIAIDPGEARVEGSVDKALLQATIRKYRRQVKYCYERALIRHPGLDGKVVLEWTIGSTGRVKKAKVLTSTMNNQFLEDCLVKRVRRWMFFALRGGGEVIVRYPFVFTTRG